MCRSRVNHSPELGILPGLDLDPAIGRDAVEARADRVQAAAFLQRVQERDRAEDNEDERRGNNQAVDGGRSDNRCR